MFAWILKQWPKMYIILWYGYVYIEQPYRVAQGIVAVGLKLKCNWVYLFGRLSEPSVITCVQVIRDTWSHFFFFLPFLPFNNTLLLLMTLHDCVTVAEIDTNTYWRHPFNNLLNPRQLDEFIIMDIDIIREQRLGAGAGLRSNRVSHAGNWNVLKCDVTKKGTTELFVLTRVWNTNW